MDEQTSSAIQSTRRTKNIIYLEPTHVLLAKCARHRSTVLFIADVQTEAPTVSLVIVNKQGFFCFGIGSAASFGTPFLILNNGIASMRWHCLSSRLSLDDNL
jgi:hypothetical protein